MAITFNISTGNPVVFVDPTLSVTFTDTTAVVSGVSAWEWSYNNTIVSSASSWSNVFFGSQSATMILSVSTTTEPGRFISVPVDFVIEPAWPTYPAFRILPDNNIDFITDVGSVEITAQNQSPQSMNGTQLLSSITYLSGLVLGVPAITGSVSTSVYETVAAPALSYDWEFMNVNVATTRNWEYQFFSPISGPVDLEMTSMAFMGTAVETNSTAFSGISSIWQTLSSVPALTETAGVCALPTQTLSISAALDFPTCDDFEPVTPTGIRGSTTLNPVVTSYELLSERIKMQIGWPMTNIELCEDQIYDFINQAIEWYSKYAGFTEEYLVFDSSEYKCGIGMNLGAIFNKIADFYCPNSVASAAVSGQYVDCDLNNFRKVVGIFSADPAGGSGSGGEILFNMDYLFAQQAYFGQMMGGFGYDITTWHMLKEWMDLRKKMFASHIYVNFNPSSQVMRLTPEPRGNRFVGVIGCRMEQSVAELVQERWVQRYSLALTKIALAHIRGKFGQVTMFGGGTINGQDLMTQGRDDKLKLEQELMDGFGEAEPPLFFIE